MYIIVVLGHYFNENGWGTLGSKFLGSEEHPALFLGLVRSIIVPGGLPSPAHAEVGPLSPLLLGDPKNILPEKRQQEKSKWKTTKKLK